MGLRSHRVEAGVEDARFLLANGVSIEEAARRVGWSVNTLRIQMERHPPRR